MRKLLLLIVFAFLFTGNLFAAEWSNTNLGNGWTGVVSTHKEPGPTGGSTDAVDSSTGTLLLVGVSDYALGGTTCTPTDSVGGMSNTWTALTAAGDDQSVTRIKFWYVDSATPNVGSGHTVTCSTAGNTYPVIFFAVAKTSASSPFDKQNATGSSGGGGTTAQPGSTGTLSAANELIISAISQNSAGALSIDSSFTITADVQPGGGNNLGGGFAWLTQAATTAVNPTWTLPSGTWATNIATFKISAGGCTPHHLTYTSQPSNAVIGGNLGTVSVGVYDSGSNLCTTATNEITLANSGGTCTGMTLNSADLSINAVNGVATWNDLTETGNTGSCTIAATASGLTGATSNAFTISAASTGARSFSLMGVGK